MSRLMDIARNFKFDPSMPPTVPSSAGVQCDKSDKRAPDPYQERARAALAKVCRWEQPVGMVPWLRENQPALYDQLVSNLPDEIHRLWEGQAPLDEFQRIIDIWLEAYRTGFEMYQRGQARCAGTEKTNSRSLFDEAE